MADQNLMKKIQGHPGFLPFWKSNTHTADTKAAGNEKGEAKGEQGGGQGEG